MGGSGRKSAASISFGDLLPIALRLYSHPPSRALAHTPPARQNVKRVGSNVAAARHASRRQHGGSDHRRPNQSPRAIRLVTRPQAPTRARRPKLCHALPAPAPLLAAAVKAGPCSARRFTTNFEHYTCDPKTCTKGTLARPRTCGHNSSAPDVSQRLAFQMKARSCCVDCESTLSNRRVHGAERPAAAA